MRERLHRPLYIAVFGSGRGSNFQAILSAMERGEIPNAEIRLVVSNNSASGILEIARNKGIPAEHISEKQFQSSAEHTEHLLSVLRSHDVNFIALAGYMKKVPPKVINEFRQRIINIHPALLPKFGGQGMHGAHVHETVIAAKEKFSGATVHIVDEEYDRGAIVLQQKVAIDPEESVESLAAKVLSVEHRIYPAAIKLFAEGKIFGRDKKVLVT